MYEGATPLSEAASLMEQERRFIRDQKNGTRVLIDAAALGKAASPLISLIFNDANEAAYTAARLSSAGADAKAVEAFE